MPIIFIDTDFYLLTTDADVTPGTTPTSVAELNSEKLGVNKPGKHQPSEKL